MNRNLKIAIVVQQCGTEVLAGAERYALNLALALAKAGNEVKVLTTQSADYTSWRNTLSAKECLRLDPNQDRGLEHSAELEIVRFPNRGFRKPLLMRLAKLLWLIEKFIPPFANKWLSKPLDLFFLWAQGPWCPELWNYLERNSENFDLIIFKSYLYAPCVLGLRASKDSVKKIFIPTAHPEPAFYRPFVESIIMRSSALGFVSKAEKRLVEAVWREAKQKEHLLISPGLGNEWSSETKESNSGELRPIIRELRHYFLVLGRVDKGKNLDFILQNTTPGMTVVFAGPGRMRIPDKRQFICLGKVSEAEKSLLLENALALLAVSKNEAFSMTTAEALAKGCPVIGWSQSAAISELIDNFGGAKFTSPEEYKELLRKFSTDPAFRQNSLPDRESIQRELSWQKSADRVIQWFEQSQSTN